MIVIKDIIKDNDCYSLIKGEETIKQLGFFFFFARLGLITQNDAIVLS